jgi:murein DD-endopeptidase MepM/ murein hydrolase activator NlpD
MNSKCFCDTYRALMIFSLILMAVLTALLLCEYRFFCRQAQQLIAVRQQYYAYLNTMDMDEKKTDTEFETIVLNDEAVPSFEELSAAQASDDPDDDDEYADDTFVVINREPQYLKQSTLDYVQDQELTALMTSIDMDQWSDYTEKTNNTFENKKVVTARVNVPVKQQSKLSVVRSPKKNCGLEWPIEKDKFWLSSLYGARKRINGTWGFHHGIDMAAVKGTFVKAARAGVIEEASFQQGYGNQVVITHDASIKTRYAHLHTIRVRPGQHVSQGAIVGTVGETGFIRKKGKDGSHLHFEVYEKGKRINPMQCLPRTI